jgi:translation initiation factor IF-1
MSTNLSIVEAVITQVMPLRRLKVQLEDGRTFEAVISPRMRHKVFGKGEVVRVELSPYDETKCRIVPQIGRVAGGK